MPGLEEWPSSGFGRGQNSAYRSAGYCALLPLQEGKEGFIYVCQLIAPAAAKTAYNDA